MQSKNTGRGEEGDWKYSWMELMWSSLALLLWIAIDMLWENSALYYCKPLWVITGYVSLKIIFKIILK